ncbi:MAG: tetratricopeptide repeat protein [Kordiimonas sp.]
MNTSKIAVLASMLMVSACSSDEEVAEEKIDYASFDTAAVQALFDVGEFEQVFTIVRAQDELRVADKDDYLILADVFLVLLNGVGAEVALEKAKEKDADELEITIRLARAYMLQTEYEDALATLGDVVLTGDDAYQALLLRGDIHREMNEAERSRFFYEAAISDQREQFKGYLGLALLELRLGNLQEAERLATEASKYVEEDAIVEYVQGTTARYLLRTEDAVAHLKRAVELHPAHILANLELAGIYIDKQEFETAQSYLDFVYSIAPEHQQARYHSALILAIQGKTKEAEDLLLRIGDYTREFPPAARVYGHVAFQLGKFTTAQPYLERFLDMVPEDRITRLALAESLTRRGEPEEALQRLQPLLQDNETDFEAYMQAASAAGLAGDMIIAIDFISKAKAIAESNGQEDQQMLTALGQRLALTRFMNGDLEKAAEQLQAMYRENPADLTSLTLLANLQMEGGDLDSARETVLRIIEIEPKKPIASNLLGAILFRQGELDAAIVSYNEAIKRNPNYISALKNRGLAYVMKREHEKALADLNKVLEAVPEDSHVHGMIGRAYLELDQVDSAIEFLQKAEAAFPRSSLILSDHSEALAKKGFMQSAISKAKLARQYADANGGLAKYLDTTIETWEKEEAERQAVLAAEEARKREEFRVQQAEKAKADAERRAAEAVKEAEREAEESNYEEELEESEDEDPPLIDLNSK